MEGGREYISERISRGNDVRSELVTYVELEMLDLEEKGVGKGHFTFKRKQLPSHLLKIMARLSKSHWVVVHKFVNYLKMFNIKPGKFYFGSYFGKLSLSK